MAASSSKFLIQIVHKESGAVVSWAPGLDIEKQFDEELLNRIKAKGVGFKTEAHVLEDVHKALEELLFEMKTRV